MFFELQLSAASFTTIVRNRLKQVRLCLDREFTGPTGERLVVDRITVGDTTSLQREQIIETVNGLPVARDTATQHAWIFSRFNHTSHLVAHLQVKQEVRIRLVAANDLETNQTEPSPEKHLFTIHPVFNVALTAANQTQGGGPLTLTYTLSHIDFGILHAALTEQQRNEVTSYLADLKLPATPVGLGALATTMRRQVRAVNAGITCDPAGTFVAMRVDFDLANSNPHVTADFFTTTPANHLGDKAWAMLIDANLLIADAQTRMGDGLRNDARIRLTSGPRVTWNQHLPGLHIGADVELKDACPFFVDNIDMDAYVNVTATISVPTTNQFVTNMRISAGPSNALEVVACALTGALLWPFIGPLMLKDEKLGTGVGAYLGGLAGGAALVFIGIIAYADSATPPGNLSTSFGNTCRKLDDEQYECSEQLDLRIPLLPGANTRLDAEQVSGIAEGLIFSGTFSGMREPAAGEMSVNVKPFAWQVTGRCQGNGQNNFTVANQARINVTAVAPAALCSWRLLPESENRYSVTRDGNDLVITPRFTPGSLASPPPCKLRVITTHGVRTLTLSPPRATTDSESAELERARLNAVASCYFWERYHTPIEQIEWWIDPVDHRDVIQVWQIVVRNLHENETVKLFDTNNNEIVTAVASPAGIAHIIARFDGANTQPAVKLELATQRSPEQFVTPPEIATQQLQFERVATLGSHAELREMHFEGGPDGQRFVIVDEGERIVFDVTEPQTPTLIERVTDIEPELHGSAHQRSAWVRSTETTVEHLDVVERIVGAAEVTATPKVGGVRDPLYVRNASGSYLFDVANREQPREVQRFSTQAWFEGFALSRNAAATLTDTGEIELYALTAQHFLGEHHS